VERNASSCRNKSSLQTNVAGQLTSASITSFLVKKGGVASAPKNHALIMDEVDGMDGNADRGGISVSGRGWWVGWTRKRKSCDCHKTCWSVVITQLVLVSFTLSK